MINLIKELIFGKKVTISKSAAVEIAKDVCTQNNYQWKEPVSVNLSRGIYSIWTNCGSKGNNFWVTIDGNQGTIIKKGVTPL